MPEEEEGDRGGGAEQEAPESPERDASPSLCAHGDEQALAEEGALGFRRSAVVLAEGDLAAQRLQAL